MITPCVLGACCDALLECHLDRVGVIDNRDVCRSCSQSVEGQRCVGLDPRYTERAVPWGLPDRTSYGIPAIA
jgi:hypothetical protein